jgi:CRISPR-associated endonuclease/helicase Cas3
MAQFLHEALRWLGEARVPVIALSATLPPKTRQELVLAYLQGALGVRDLDVTGLPVPAGYPSCSWATAVDGAAVFGGGAAQSWRSSVPVEVTLLEEPSDGSPEPVVAQLVERLAGGGCALVVRNTVGRAQQTYQAVRAAFGPQAVLLHSRLTAGERADRTERVLDLLGPAGPGRQRPHRLVVVATQLAEQSFDVDVDLLITDLAPIDLLLQRVGRLHRHARPAGDRPSMVAEPQVVVTGMRGGASAAPAFPRGSTYVYGRHTLLRAAALVIEACEAGSWSIPDEVPDLVRRGYQDGADLPPPWRQTVDRAAAEHADKEAARRATAVQFLLSGPDDLGAVTLAGLHDRRVADPAGLDDEDAVMAVVRDGDPSVEVVLVRRDEHGYLSLDGRPLGPTGEAVSNHDVLERVVRDTVRLRPEVTEVALAELSPLPGWAGDPWLGRTRALVLDPSGSAALGGWEISYDHDLGLRTTRAKP